MALDNAGNLYISDEDSVVLEVSASTGIINSVAGDGWLGRSSDGVPATGTKISFPLGVAVDASGNLYIADWGDNAVRKVTASTGIISTVAGNWTQGQRRRRSRHQRGA